MPEQALLKIVKRWRRYVPREKWSEVPLKTRGFYVLYRNKSNSTTHFEVVYIGVAGVGKKLRRGIVGRLRSHNKRIEGWTHYSFFEVHDNVTREDIKELESLLLSIFRHDPRIELENVQRSSRALYKLRQRKLWPKDGRNQRRSPGNAHGVAMPRLGSLR
jgi:hypothetical protein